MSARAEIYARLGSACKTERPDAVAWRESLGSAPTAPLPAEDISEAFLLNVCRSKGSVQCASGRMQAAQAIARFHQAVSRNQRLTVGSDPRLGALPWRDAGLLPRFGAADPDDSTVVSFAPLGVAETGQVVTWTGKANPGVNNLLPQHHIVLVDAADLVPDMEYAWRELSERMALDGRPRGIQFIAGPSRTSDIEGQLQYGAHGPRNFHVILLEDYPSGAQERVEALYPSNLADR
ncbi:MAG: lactate utilization protein [Pseudomonadota bacterium]